MTRYRCRGTLLLLLMGYATACASGSSQWQSPAVPASPDGGISAARYIEGMSPEQIRITTEDRTQYLLYTPSVEGDEIVSSDGLSVPIADIVELEVWDENGGDNVTKSAVAGVLGGIGGVAGLFMLLALTW